MLKSPQKKKVRPVNYADDADDAEEDDKEGNVILEQEEWKSAAELEPWDPESLKTGEEDEINLFSTRCKLFNWIDDKESQGSWKERGLGMLKLNVANSNTSSARLGMH